MKSFSEHNKNFYNKSDHHWLEELAVIKGINNNEDLETLRVDLQIIIQKTPQTILEIGSGYGRVARWFSINFPKVKYRGVDFSENCVKKCRETFKKNTLMRFTQADIPEEKLITTVRNEFSIVLWPWSGFLEIQNSEKRKALTNIFNLLSSRGYLIIDLPKEICSGEKLLFKNNSIVEQHSSFGYVLNQLLPSEEIEQLLLSAGFYFKKKTEYLSSRGFKRYYFIVNKRLGG